MQNASGKNLSEFFNDWYYEQGYPVYSIPCAISTATNNIQVTINQTQSDPSVSFFKMPVPLKFKDATHDTIIVFDNTYSGQQYTVNPGFRPDSILFDPDKWIVTKNDTVIMSVAEYPGTTFSIYPNPATSDLSIVFTGYKFQGAYLYDISGRLVRKVDTDVSQQGNVSMKMSDIANGIYFIKVIFNDKSVAEKLVKM